MSAGNHAGAVAYAAAAAGIPVTVVMPQRRLAAKAEAARGYGATVELYGADTGETFQRMQQLLARARRPCSCRRSMTPMSSRGRGPPVWRSWPTCRTSTVVVAGVGGGGLLSGVAAAVKQLRPGVRVYGVEPVGSDAMTLALAAGAPVSLRPRSIADGLDAPFAGVWTIDLFRRYVDQVVLVEDAVIAAGMRFALERMKQLLEPAGAAALGAVLAGAIPLRDGDVVCVIASGGNVDLDRLPTLLGSSPQS